MLPPRCHYSLRIESNAITMCRLCTLHSVQTNNGRYYVRPSNGDGRDAEIHRSFSLSYSYPLLLVLSRQLGTWYVAETRRAGVRFRLFLSRLVSSSFHPRLVMGLGRMETVEVHVQSPSTLPSLPTYWPLHAEWSSDRDR